LHSGNGSLPHLATALFDDAGRREMVHIPYKSGGLSVQSVLAGDTQVTFATGAFGDAHVLTGKLRGLAVTTRGRSPLVEGLPGMEKRASRTTTFPSGTDFFAPKATPRDIVARLFRGATQALQDPNMKAVLRRRHRGGCVPVASGLRAFCAGRGRPRRRDPRDRSEVRVNGLVSFASRKSG